MLMFKKLCNAFQRKASPCLCGFLPLLGVSMCWAEPIHFTSVSDALKQGMNAYQGGYYDVAIPALEYAANKKEFLAEYYLARIYSENSAPHTNHAKAYRLFQSIADEYADVDPEDDPHAPYVGKSLTAMAGYLRNGITEIHLSPDLDKAILYLRNASATFDDEDAQFELAKLQLKGEGIQEDSAMGRHWLSVLSERGHAGAQAFLADMLWHGKNISSNKPRALALISVAIDNSPIYERLWIDDIYQNIFCMADEGVRQEAKGILLNWGNRYDRRPEEREVTGLGFLRANPIRTCQNGETVTSIKSLNKDEKRSEIARPF